MDLGHVHYAESVNAMVLLVDPSTQERPSKNLGHERLFLISGSTFLLF
jgi:hypothetical protein